MSGNWKELEELKVICTHEDPFIKESPAESEMVRVGRRRRQDEDEFKMYIPLYSIHHTVTVRGIC